MASPQDKPSAREPMFNVPASVVVLIALLAAAHAARVLAPEALSNRILNDYALVASTYSAPAATWFERFVPPFSHLFLHINLVHVSINCVWLLAFGPAVARRFGGPAFFAFFILCGLGGAVGFVALEWGQDIGAIGASGAISGVTAAAIRMIRLREPMLDAASYPMLPLFSSQVLLFAFIWMGANLLTGILGIGTLGTAEAIAWQAHLGGFLAGLLLAGPFEHFVGLAAKLRRSGA